MSDILIKNVKMPDCCFRCPFKNHDGMWVRCIFTGENVEPETRRETKASSCPLIKVPTPHRRLIEEPKQLSYDGLAYISPTDSIGTAEYFLDQIRAMPTIIEAEGT
jgi:hypothetical protein